MLYDKYGNIIENIIFHEIRRDLPAQLVVDAPPLLHAHGEMLAGGDSPLFYCELHSLAKNWSVN